MTRPVLRLIAAAFAFCLAVALPAASGAGPPERVVSTSPALTEMVFALGAGGRLAAVSDYCKWPEEATEKPRTGGLFDTNVERLMALRPDLVLLTPYHRELQPRLRNVSIPSETIPAENVSEILAAIEQLGEFFGARERAASLTADIRGRLEQLEKAAPPPEDRPRVLLFLGTEESTLSNAMGVGPGTFLDEMLRAAGGRNLLENARAPYPQLSVEAIIRTPPDVVVFLGGEPWESEEEQARAERMARQRWNARLGYVTEDFPRFIFLRGGHPQIPGPSFIDYAEWLAGKLSPESPAGS